MAIASGTRLGPYEILSPLGAGGMGEVYKARDTRLERTVAIKVLPAHLSSSEEVRRRFDREAKTISALSHPHICALYDVGHQDGIDYLVMEYLQGETLTDRLAKGPLPLGHVLRYGIEIADALDKAHRQGIVHRDLKPGNVMLTGTGVKLVDFGLAKLAAPASPGGLSIFPTQAGENLTAEGTILGTFQYMAPEQLEGREADARSDIFALGSVLYEMATGKKAFSGRTQASLIGAILRDDPPPISVVAPMSPPTLNRVVKTCLAKDPEDRFQTAHDVKLELQWIAEGGSQAGLPAPVVARRKSRERLAWGLAALALLAALAGAAGTSYFARRARTASRPVRSSILPPENWSFETEGSLALSPDGRQLAFAARSPERKTLLWVRPFDSSNARLLPDTEGAAFPFWSPDSRFIGFFAGGKLKRIDASGGPSQTICDAPIGRGGSWNRDGVILFAPRNRTAIYRVSASGGDPKPVMKFDSASKEGSQRWPFFLPDGRHFLFLSLGARDPNRVGQLFVGSLDSSERKSLFDVDSNAVYVPSGYLFFERESNLMAQRFDASRLQVRGEPFLVGERISVGNDIFHADFSVALDGVVAYKNSALSPAKLSWLDRAGKDVGAFGEPAYYRSPRLSPDGRRISVIRMDPRTQQGDLWIGEIDRESATRFSFQPGLYRGHVWSPDGNDLVYGFRNALIRKKIGDVGKEEEIVKSAAGLKRVSDWSPDGRYVLYDSLEGETGWDLLLLPMSGDRKPVPLLATPFNEILGRFSPDGKWIVYVSNESGKSEVYARPFPGPGAAVRVSTAGGSWPIWSRGGSEIFYVAEDQKLMAVGVKNGARLEVGKPRPLFEFRGIEDQVVGIGYDVTPDGQRFLVATPLAEKSLSPITLVLNWTAEPNK